MKPLCHSVSGGPVLSARNKDKGSLHKDQYKWFIDFVAEPSVTPLPTALSGKCTFPLTPEPALISSEWPPATWDTSSRKTTPKCLRWVLLNYDVMKPTKNNVPMNMQAILILFLEAPLRIWIFRIVFPVEDGLILFILHSGGSIANLLKNTLTIF
jgi:hypothetical protein